MGTVTFLAPAIPQWVWPELKLMGVLRRLLGNESPFGWCDFITSAEPDGPCAEFCDHFGPVVRLTRVDRRYEVTCLRTGASKRTTTSTRRTTSFQMTTSARMRLQPLILRNPENSHENPALLQRGPHSAGGLGNGAERQSDDLGAENPARSP